ncbi:MAG: phosphoenolpyruvate--protein phosphotransferase [Oscillospiraceae bacterium]
MNYYGNSVSPGVAIGKCYIYRSYMPIVSEKHILHSQQDEMLVRFEQAKKIAADELLATEELVAKNDISKAKIFKAHRDILADVAIAEEVEEEIRSENSTTEWAVETVFRRFIKLLSKSKDAIIAERAADLTDVKNRILRVLAGEKENNLSNLSEPVIIIAHDLLPSDTATLDRKNVLGIIAETGGSTSHSAIIAKSYGIPAVLGVEGVVNSLIEGEEIILDAVSGAVIGSPSAEQKEIYTKKQAELSKIADIEKEYLYRDCVTKDGVKIDIGLNIGSHKADELEKSNAADLIGLFRSEFLYMESKHLPTEDEQFEAYKSVLEKMGNRPVTLRTLDIGGDKTLSYMQLPQEDNPVLGVRALRLCFENPEIFSTQLRAALRASVFGNLWLMLPMVSSIDDIRKAKGIIEKTKSQLNEEGCKINDALKIGIMIEVPSIAMVSELVADECDFASIGTNDLCQYLFAVDRMNPKVSDYCQSNSAPMFRIIKQIVSAFNAKGKPICVCGEMGGDEFAAPVLVGLGMRKLSMSASRIGKIKHILSKITIEQAEKLSQNIIDCRSFEQSKAILDDFHNLL